MIMHKAVIRTETSITRQKRVKLSGIAKCIIVGIMHAAEAVQSIGSKVLVKKSVNEKGTKRLRIRSRTTVAIHEIIIVTIITEYAAAPSFRTM